jgi:ferredoxin
MAIVKIVNTGKEYEVPDGSNLMKLKEFTDEIIFACGVGMCGSCLARIVEGKENLEEPTEVEREYLEQFAPDRDDLRLLCQTVIKSGTVVIEYPTSP